MLGDYILSNRAYLRIDGLYYSAPSSVGAVRTRVFPIRTASTVATGLDEEQEQQSLKPEKVLIDGHLYIIMPDGSSYSATGEKVK